MERSELAEYAPSHTIACFNLLPLRIEHIVLAVGKRSNSREGVLGIAIAFIAGVIVGAVGLIVLVIGLLRHDSGQENIHRLD